MPGIGIIIKLIVEAIMGTEDRIRELERQKRSLEQAAAQIQAARSIEQTCLDTVVSLTKSWTDLTQQASDLSGFLKLINELPALAPVLCEDAKQTWIKLEEMIARW